MATVEPEKVYYTSKQKEGIDLKEGYEWRFSFGNYKWYIDKIPESPNAPEPTKYYSDSKKNQITLLAGFTWKLNPDKGWYTVKETESYNTKVYFTEEETHSIKLKPGQNWTYDWIKDLYYVTSAKSTPKIVSKNQDLWVKKQIANLEIPEWQEYPLKKAEWNKIGDYVDSVNYTYKDVLQAKQLAEKELKAKYIKAIDEQLIYGNTFNHISYVNTNATTISSSPFTKAWVEELGVNPPPKKEPFSDELPEPEKGPWWERV